MPTRRRFLAAGGAALSAGAIAGSAGCSGVNQAQAATPPLSPEHAFLAKLGQGLTEEFDYVAEVDGRLPEGLGGTLYRNGPGLFDRGGARKWNLLDGDGMLRVTSFADGQARFRTRFVRTAKYQAEDKAGAFLYPTWATPGSGSFTNIPSRSQAGITPVVKNGVLFAFDEVSVPYTLDPASLATTGTADPCTVADGPASYKAHTKTDGTTGNWILVGGRGQRNPDIHVVVNDASGKGLAHVATPNPRNGYTYYHDFFWTGREAVFHLQPAFLSPIPMLLGTRTFVDSLSWRPDQGGMLLVVDPSGERAPLALDVPAVWMWHSLNAHRVGDTIVADFVGYDAPDHFLGPEATFRTIMQGREGVARSPGKLRRFTIDLPSKRARLETVADGHFEFPMVPLSLTGRRHRYGYVAVGDLSRSWYHDGVARIDVESGQRREFRFGPGHYVGEPVFAPNRHGGDETDGWLLCEVLDGRSEKSLLAVFDAGRVEDGPVARVRLHHHLPVSFHGWWETA
jgi:all-trans-8'-apo-beta-carotenal 15,15'-oxygenase